PPPPPPPPQPDPEPEPDPGEPVPTPDPEDPPEDEPEPTPTPDPRRIPTEADKKKSGLSIWQRWWEIHRWKYARAEQATPVTTPSWEGDQENRLKLFLTEALKHRYFDVRSAAALALGKAKESGPTSVLLDLVKDSHPTVRESAVLALGMCGAKKGIPQLKKILEKSGSGDRLKIHAALALGLINDTSNGNLLLQIARNSRASDEVRGAAFLALSLMKYEPAALEMVTLISARAVKDELLGTAATALAKMGIKVLKVGKKKIDVVEFLFRALETYRKERALRQSIALAIPELLPLPDRTKSTAVRRLLRVLATERDDNTRGFLVLGLGELAKESPDRAYALKILRRTLTREKDREVKALAALATAIANDREAIQPLRSLFLKRGTPTSVRSAIALALGLLGDIDSTKDFVKEIEGRGDPVLKGYCCMALGLMGEKKNLEALPVLRRVVLEGKIPEVRAAAAMALARLGARDALDILLSAMREENHYFRLSAIMAVGYFRHTKALDPLIELFKSDEVNDEARAIILVALGHISEKGEVPVLKRISAYYNFLQTRFHTLHQIARLL
ncbi:MAG: HEAT repeat domain-containing protein, partial [Planctomycetota bacterium]